MKPDGIVFDLDGTLIDLPIQWEKVTPENQLQYELDAVAGLKFSLPVISMLRRLSTKYKLAILTRNYTVTAERLLWCSRLSGVYVVGRDFKVKGKPDPEGLQHVADVFESDNLVMVGDTYHDVDCAKNFGCPSILTKNPTRKYQPKDADHTIETITDLEALLD